MAPKTTAVAPTTAATGPTTAAVVVSVHVRGLATTLLSLALLARDRHPALGAVMTPPLLFDMLTAQIGLRTFKANWHALLTVPEVTDADASAEAFAGQNMAAMVQFSTPLLCSPLHCALLF